jgi:hypothetical protein
LTRHNTTAALGPSCADDEGLRDSPPAQSSAAAPEDSWLLALQACKHAVEGTCTVHAPDGQQHLSLLRVLRQACIHARIDEVLPDLPDEDRPRHFVVLRPPGASAPSTVALASGGLPEGMLVRQHLFAARPVSYALRLIGLGEAELRALCDPKIMPGSISRSFATQFTARICSTSASLCTAAACLYMPTWLVPTASDAGRTLSAAVHE